ncbi:MAG: hypothetical protein M3Y34_04790, partial [Actinomycetota bacterium]|nr:hypothetical protein [Actinomycetota bacterium]
MRNLVRGRVAAVAFVAGAAALAAPSAAQAEITQVFTDTATPVACEVQSAPNEGVRFCSNHDG